MITIAKGEGNGRGGAWLPSISAGGEEIQPQSLQDPQIPQQID